MRDRPIHIFVIDNRIEKVKKALKNGIDVDIKGENSCTPLHYACQNSNLQIVKLLLLNRANVNAKNRYSTLYPIFDTLTAINQENSFSILKLLIEAGADINKVDSFGNTALHYAVERGNQKLIELLLLFGCDVNKTQRYDKNRPLHFACFQKNEKIVKILIEAGADSDLLNLYNRTAISYL